MGRKVTFKVFDWRTVDDGKEIVFYATGKTEDNKSVCCKVRFFRTYCYLELPSRKNWTARDARVIYRHFCKKLGTDEPLSFDFQKKFELYLKKPKFYVKFTFACFNHANHLFNLLKWPQKIDGLGKFGKGELKLHEHKIEDLIKYTVIRRIKIADWIEVEEYKKRIANINQDDLEEDDRFSSADIDVVAHWKKVRPVTKTTPVFYTLFSFDLECYSVNHNSKDPEPEDPQNVIFQIGVTFKHGSAMKTKIAKFLLSLYDCPPIDDCTVKNYLNERKLLLGFFNLIQETNPDILIGYNILKFDWNYMIIRCNMLGITKQLQSIGRILDMPSPIKQLAWSSSAYGQQDFSYLWIYGRLNVDLLPEVERNFKFDKYTLDFVSQQMLKEKKEDVTYKQLFQLTYITQKLTPYRKMKKIDRASLKRIKTFIVESIHQEDMVDGDGNVTVMKTFYDGVMNATVSNIHEAMGKGIWYIGVYCVQDTVLPIKLFEKMNIWPGLEQMANTVGIPPSYLQTRGQQIKVLAQVYRKILRQNIVVPEKSYRDAITDKYQGAKVFKAVPGDYNNIAVLDFASLYPSIIIAYNICWTTFVTDDDPIPDEECHVIEWDDHVNCEHDPEVIEGKKKSNVGKKTKKKQKDGTFIEVDKLVLCGPHRYRFMKPIKDKEGNIVDREGVLPNLLKSILGERKKVKAVMFENEFLVKMHEGKIEEEELEFCRKKNWRIIGPGELSEKELFEANLQAVVANALQLALKVSANSSYGTLGARTGPIPLFPGAASVTAKGRQLIQLTADMIQENYPESRLVYGDTDSVMINFGDHLTLKESFDTAKKAASEVSAALPNPLFLEFENMYGRFFLLTKKRYVTYSVNSEGDVLGVTKKGVVTKRRDNCHYLKDVYNTLMKMILDQKPKEEFMHTLYDMCNNLFHRNIPARKFVVYKGIKSLDNYDDDLNISHVVLARRMKERGTVLPPNTRMEYLFLDTGDPELEELQGNKAEDYIYYRDNKARLGLKIDPLYYLEKQIKKPITELINVKYPPQPLEYVEPELYIFGEVASMPLAIQKELHQLVTVRDKVYRLKIFCQQKIDTIKDTKKYVKVREVCEKWEASNREERKLLGYDIFGHILKLSKEDVSCISRLRGVQVVNYILSDSTQEVPEKLKEACIIYKNRYVLQLLCRQYGMSAPKFHKPNKHHPVIKRDEYLMKNFVKAHENYKKVARHISELGSRLKYEDIENTKEG